MHTCILDLAIRYCAHTIAYIVFPNYYHTSEGISIVRARTHIANV